MAKTQKKRANGQGNLSMIGRTWYARWTHNGKAYCKTTGTSNRREAEKFLEEITAPFRLGGEQKTLETFTARISGVKAELEAFEDSKPALSVLEGWEAYFKSTRRPDTGPDTMRMYESQYNRLVDWLKANHPDVKELRQVTKETGKAFAQDLAEKLSANSFNKYMTLFRRMWKVLYTEARLTCNPWDKDEIRPKRQTGHTRRELTVEELAAVCGSVSGEMRTLFAVGIYTGLRLGDAIRLDWGDVDLVRSLLSVVPRKTARDSQGKRVIIPIHRALAEILSETPSKSRRGKVMAELSHQYDSSSANLSRKIQSIFSRCDIQTVSKSTKGGRGRVEVGFHSLRHTFVSLSANAGTPLAIVQAIVGHSNPAMTRHYYHESEDALISAVEALPDVTGTLSQIEAPDAVRATLDGIMTELEKLTDNDLAALEQAIKNERKQRISETESSATAGAVSETKAKAV